MSLPWDLGIWGAGRRPARRPPGVRPWQLCPPMEHPPGSDRPRPASALLNSDPRRFKKTSQAQMRWRQVTTQERPWRMKRCSSRSTSRGRKGSLETGLKLGNGEYKLSRPGLNYRNEAVTAGCQRACPTSPRVFQARSLALVSLFRKDSCPRVIPRGASSWLRRAPRQGCWET